MRNLLAVFVSLAGLLAAAPVDMKPGKTMGTPVAAITVEVYSDFQCPGCKVLHDTWMPRLLHDYVSTGKVYLIQHDFPLNIHAYAKTAAYYANAAERIG